MSKFFTEIKPEFTELFRKEVEDASSVVVSSHMSPDDDSIASVLSIYYYITKYMGKGKEKVRMLYTGEKTTKWKNFKNFDEIEFVDDIFGYIKKDDLVIFADGSGWGRFSRKPEIADSKFKTICIDHHHTPSNKFDLHIVASTRTSTAEVIYRLFYEKEKLDKNICEILFLGISGDTGNFRYIKPTDASVFLIAERLVREGEIMVDSLQSRYESISEKVYSCLIKLMQNSEIKEIPDWPKFIVSWVDTETVTKLELTDNQISEASGIFTRYLKGIENVSWGFVATPRSHDNSSSISGRSIPGSVSIRIMMEQTKFGGGHDRAAGGKIFTKEPKDATHTILAWMEKNKPTLV